MTVSAVLVADDENLDLARAYGFDAVECPNDAKGRKWNAGFAYAAREGADQFVLVGSDNWIHPDTFATLPTDFVSVAAAIDFVDVRRGVLQHARHVGLIPWVIPRVLLARTGFAPIPDKTQRSLETILQGGLGHPEWSVRAGACGVDFKTDESMSPYAGVTNSTGDGVEHDIRELDRHYPAHLVESAIDLTKELA